MGSNESESAEKLAQEWEDTFHAMDDAVFIMDKDHAILRANASFLDMVDLSKEEVLGKKCYEVFHDRDKPFKSCPAEISLESEETEKEEFYEPSRDKYYYSWVQPIVTDDGEINRFVHQLRDITERKKTREREEFFHSLLRHDLRNKISITEGYLELLEEQEELSEEGEDFLQRAREANKNSYELIENVRKLREMDEEEPKEVKLDLAIKNAIGQLEEKASKEDIEVEYIGCSCKVVGGNLLKEVFSNIIKNSIRHSDGSLIRIQSQSDENEATIVMEDDGKGIPDDKKEKIFEKGYKENNSSGSGLGLSLVKGILKNYNGVISLEDSELGGAKFIITLPIP